MCITMNWLHSTKVMQLHIYTGNLNMWAIAGFSTHKLKCFLIRFPYDLVKLIFFCNLLLLTIHVVSNSGGQLLISSLHHKSYHNGWQIPLCKHYCRRTSVVTIMTELGPVYESGVGVTKAPFVNFSVSRIFDLAKVPVRLFASHSYLTGVTAAELRQHLSNMKVIYNS